jgi:hypothetical protein
LSPLETYLRGEVELLKKGAGKEFDEALARANPTLETIQAHGGDPRFALCVLTSARWRRLNPLGAEFGRWKRLLGQFLKEPELHTLLATKHEPRGMLKQATEDALAFLQSFHTQDEGILDSRVTRFVTAHERRASVHLDRAIGVLAWHLREGTTGKFDRRVTLAQLVGAFWSVRRRGSGTTDPIPFESVKQRLQRSDKDFTRRFDVTFERVRFHDLHRFLATTLHDEGLARCGTACPPGIADPDDPLAKGEILIEPRQPAPRVHDDQGLRGSETPKTTEDSITIEFPVTVPDENPPESGSAPPSPTGDQPKGSTSLNAPDEQENT